MLPKSIEEMNKIREDCYAMVTKRALASAGAGLVPLPGVDVAADVAMLVELLPAISRKFGLSKEQIEEMDITTKTLLCRIITQIGKNLVGQVVTKESIIQLLKVAGKRIAVKQIAKFVPIIGQAAGATISYFAMKWMGDSHVDDCYKVVLGYLQQQEAFKEAAASSSSN